MAKLKRTLGLAECVFFGVGSILGAGIYTLIGKVVGWAGDATWLAFLLASVTALCTAFSYAELTALFPKAGGEYVFAKKAFGNKAGVFLGLIVASNGIVTGATVAVGFAGYLGQLIGIPLLAASTGILLLIFLVNISGIRQSSVVNIIFTVIEVGGLVFIIAMAVPCLGEADYLAMPAGGVHDFLTASALAFFAFVGFEELVKLAEETKDPTKNIPRALFITSIVVLVIYGLVAISVVSVVPSEELGKSKSPLADVASSVYGQAGLLTIAVIALFSTSNTILSNMIGASRVLLNMGKETKILKAFSKVSDKRQTPVAALVLIAVVMISLALIGNIETIAFIANIFIFIAFFTINLSVIMLRIKSPKLNRPYRIPFSFRGIPLVSVTGLLLVLLLLSYNTFTLFTLGAQ